MFNQTYSQSSLFDYGVDHEGAPYAFFEDLNENGQPSEYQLEPDVIGTS
jgi:hypothetical protein